MTQNRNNDVLSFKKLVSAIDKCAQNRVAHYSNKRLAYKLPIKYFSSNQICMNGETTIGWTNFSNLYYISTHRRFPSCVLIPLSKI